ncbi:pilus assembly protein TadG-related protein [Rhodococcus sp. SGAir0479]|uniref:pilus assembly protein TadG-related protein n=1 Tax=Rhodococcus sp. SGAir0479 TaxID=2567884 RepID=UPI0020C7671E|nr:pilus assembly protein TadG-related protein [Rhodococcus sp. SGAir0479]
MSGSRDGEAGAVAVVVAILMVALLGFAAISVDVGANFVEKRQLQNGADAAALAIAQETLCKNTTNGTGAADAWAKANVNDGGARGSAVVDAGRRRVTATATALDSDGELGRRNLFAPVLGHDRTQIAATATAGCGYPLAGTATLPLTFHRCHFTTPGVKILVAYNTTAPRCNGVSGNVVPGNFGWLRGADGGCAAIISTSVYATPGDNGNNIPSACKSEIEKLRGAVALLPIYDVAGGGGGGGWFHVVGFAAFKIEGYRFSGNPEYNWRNNIHGALSCTGNCRGVIGRFVETVSLETDMEMGGEDFGVTIVNLLG